MQKTPISKDLIIYEGLDMKVRLEYNDSYAIVHMREANNFSIKSFRKLLEIREPLYEFLRTVGYDKVYAAVPKANNKIKRLAMMVGFRYIGSQGPVDLYIYGDE